MGIKRRGRVLGFLSIKTQFDNLGDALINRELCRLVADRVKSYVDFSRAPVEFQNSMKVSGHRNLIVLREGGFPKLIWKMIAARFCGDECYFFLNPGGLGGRKKPLKSLISAFIYNFLLTLLYVLGVKICHVGISYDAMAGIERYIALWRRRVLYSFVVRDNLSYKYLDDIGMKADGIVPDLSFNLYNGASISSSSRNKVAFSFRFDGKAGAKLIEKLVLRVIEEYGPAFEYIFVVQVARDREGTEALLEICRKKEGKCSLLLCHEDIEALSTFYSQCDAIYSNRLHALLLAAHSGASPYAAISMGKQPKIEGMFNDLGISDRLLFIDSVGINITSSTPIAQDKFRAEGEFLGSYFNNLLRKG